MNYKQRDVNSGDSEKVGKAIYWQEKPGNTYWLMVKELMEKMVRWKDESVQLLVE